jgi:opacity protein-like surface antigen
MSRQHIFFLAPLLGAWCIAAGPAGADEIDWSGFTVGGIAGYATGSLVTTESSLTTDGTLFGITPGSFNTWPGNDSTAPIVGGFGGVLAGYNFQSGGAVLGFETDIAGANLTSHSTIPGQPGGDPRIETSAALQWLGTARGTIGFAAGKLHVYGTAGFAYGHGRGEIAVTPSGGTVDPTFTASNEQMQTGYAVGAGAEAALGAHWVARLEYLYVDLGKQQYDFTFAGGNGSTATSAEEVAENLFRAALRYRF